MTEEQIPEEPVEETAPPKETANRANRRSEKQKEHIGDNVTFNEELKKMVGKQANLPAKEYRDIVAAAMISMYEKFAEYIHWELSVLAVEEALSEIDSLPYIKGKEYDQVEDMLDRLHIHVEEIYKKLFKAHYNQIMKRISKMNNDLLLHRQGFLDRTVDRLSGAGKTVTKLATVGIVNLERRQL